MVNSIVYRGKAMKSGARRKVLQLCLLSLVIIMVGANSPAIADTKRELAECAAKESSAERLVCYDDLAQSLGVDKPTTQTSTHGQWRVRTEVSPIDDSQNVYISLSAETPFKGWLKSELGTLMLRCKENRTSAFVVTGMAAQSGYRRHDQSETTIRYDRDNAIKIWMNESTDNTALFFPNPISEIKRMMQHETMLFQFLPFNSSSSMTTFVIAGLSEAIVPLREACSW